MKWFHATLISFLALATMAPTAHAAQWPEHTVKLIVPFPPGSSNDVLARLLAKELEHEFKKPFVVENKPGASAAIGIGDVARAEPDGYTVLVVSNSMVTNLATPGQVKYDVFRDFEPVTLAAKMPVVMVTRGALPIKNIDELIALAKSEPEQLSYGSSGSGSPHHLTSELFQSVTDTKLLHVPYKGQNPILMDLLAGRIDVGFITLGPALPHIQSGELTLMGLIGDERSDTAPSLPTLAEQGIKGVNVDWWLGVFVPKNTPEDIVKTLNHAIAKLSDAKHLKPTLNANALDFVGGTSAEFAQDLEQEIDTWQDVAKRIGLTNGVQNATPK